ncbi:hypothetical protein [Pseudokordiimonas caeni]|uniref:hypothetical protein n=1 Tax=Pseudokordiimonas caeni TaxID=2997908 RepID=UPI002810CAA0|nr:hypothetical protein [Pseudokordiimonas caeni]
MIAPMITDYLARLFASAVPGARALGLVDEAIGIQARHRRQAEAWAPHLTRTRDIIRDHLGFADPAEPIVVLGAGLGLDLPLGALDAHPAGALLIDAVRLPAMRKRLRAYDNLGFELHDVTGLIRPYAQAKDGAAVEAPALAPVPVAGAGMIVSVNLLSQLALPFIDSPPESDEDKATRRALVAAHLDALKAADCPVLLITDVMREETDALGPRPHETVPNDLIADWPAEEIARWDWHLAPKGENRDGTTVTLQVGAWFRR